MNNREKIKKLTEVIEREIKISPEASNAHFMYDDLNSYAVRTGLAKSDDSVYNNSDNYYMTSISDLKHMSMIFNDVKGFGGKDIKNIIEYADYTLRGLETFEAYFSKDAIESNFYARSQAWIDYAKLHNINVQTEADIIKENLQSLNLLDEFSISLVALIKAYKNIVIIHKEVEDSIGYDSMSDYDSTLEEKIKYDKLINEASEKARIKLLEIVNDSDLSSILNKDIMPFEDILKAVKMDSVIFNISTQIKNISEKILEANLNTHLFHAEQFIKESRNLNNDFTGDKSYKSSKHVLEFELDLGKNSKYSNIYMFYDNSIVIKDNKGNLIMPISNSESKEYIKEIFKSCIDLKLKKHPYVAKVFKSLLENDLTTMSYAISAMNNYTTNENILKASGFDIMDKDLTTFERLDDKINECVLNHNIKQYAHSISSNKYKHLYDEDSYLLIRELYDLNIETSVLQDLIGKKMAAFKSSDEFNTGLTKLLNTFTNFSPELIEEKAKLNNIKIVSNENNIMILEIKNFEQSQNIGSSSWCISRDRIYFDSYTSYNANQYFIYDFNKKSTDIESMIGLTLTSSGDYHAAHKKNDNNIRESELREIQLKIVKGEPENYPNLSHNLRIELAKRAFEEKKNLKSSVGLNIN